MPKFYKNISGENIFILFYIKNPEEDIFVAHTIMTCVVFKMVHVNIYQLSVLHIQFFF